MTHMHASIILKVDLGSSHKMVVGVSSCHRQVNFKYCASGSDGVPRGHEIYTGLGRISLRPVAAARVTNTKSS